MELVLIRSPQSPDERIFNLKPGINTFGSSVSNDLNIQSVGILPHHLNIEYSLNTLYVSGAKRDSYFIYQGKSCHQAVVRAGESFTVNDIPFYCHAMSGSDPTQHAMFVPSTNRIPAPAVTAASAPSGTDTMQISAFVMQKQVSFPLLIGRNSRCDLVLGHPQVSAYHAKITREGGRIMIEDLDSSNGTYVSDVPVKSASLQPGDSIVIMPYLLLFTGEYINVYTFQRESKLIGYQVSVAAGTKKILDRVTIACSSNELVGLIGPSGSGKTTLMKCLSGQTMPAGGRVQLNGLEVYSHFKLFKRNIGYVPQDDILHRELTVQQTLMYAARLRLPQDMSEKERKTRVWETLIELELEEQERQAVHSLSGGQRKRVNIAIELLTKPGMLFLDEPTSGLDPALDEKLMLLFKKLSQDGRITVLTTHLLEHANMFSRIALMHYGRLIFFGTPSEATDFFQVNAVSALYSKIKTRPAEEWQEEFQKTASNQNEAARLRDQVLPSRRGEVSVPHYETEPASHQLSQWRILSRRYLDIILRDRKNTGILLLQAPLIAFFITIATSNLSSRLFMMALAALWFGCNNSAREICKELQLYRRERMVNLSILPYLCSKFVILFVLVVLQCLVLALLTPHQFFQAYWPLLLCGLAGVAMGLFVSSIVDSPDKAIALVPIILIPQVLFSGIFGELYGFRKTIGEVMVSKWSYNLLKKEFELPSFEYKGKLENQIDTNQEKMKESQEEIEGLQEDLQRALNKMEHSEDPVQLEVQRYDAGQITTNLRSEQRRIETARKKMEDAEKDLRSKAKLFVWIDHPQNKSVEWIVLSLFTLLFLTGSALQLQRKDRLLLSL